jgi:hypothetical protein
MPAPPAPPAPRPGYDGVSVGALVCSLVCVAAPVGLGLGIAGLVRTSGGRRRGRWAAVTGTVVGALVTALAIAAVPVAIWYDAGTIRPGGAEVGQCADLERRAGSAGVTLRERGCSEPHDAEVVHAGRFDEDLVASYDGQMPDDFCRNLLPEDVRNRLDPEEVHLGLVLAGRAAGPREGDEFLCYADGRTGDLEEPLT